MVLYKITESTTDIDYRIIKYIGIKESCIALENQKIEELDKSEIRFIKQNCDGDMCSIIANLNINNLREHKHSKIGDYKDAFCLDLRFVDYTPISRIYLSTVEVSTDNCDVFTIKLPMFKLSGYLFLENQYYDFVCITLIDDNGYPHRFETFEQFIEYLRTLKNIIIL